MTSLWQLLILRNTFSAWWSKSMRFPVAIIYYGQKPRGMCLLRKKYKNSLLHDIWAFSFTTDIWRSDAWCLPSPQLHSGLRKGAHTKLGCQTLHIVARDKAKNMLKPLDDPALVSLPYVAHTLQSVVKEGRLAQRSVAHVETVWRKILNTPFKHQATRSGSISGTDLKSELLILRLRFDSCCHCAAETLDQRKWKWKKL